MAKKIDPETRKQIVAFSKDNTAKATAEKFGVSAATVLRMTKSSKKKGTARSKRAKVSSIEDIKIAQAMVRSLEQDLATWKEKLSKLV